MPSQDSSRVELDPDDFQIRQRYARYILSMWKYRAWRNARAHYRTADQLRIRSVFFMLAHAIAAVTILGFSSLDFFFAGHPEWKLLVAIAALASVLLAIVQLLMRHEARSQQHKFAAGEFSNLQRKIERYLGLKSYKMGLIHNINRELNFVTKNYPAVPKSIWDKKTEHDEEIEKTIRRLEAKLDKIVAEEAEQAEKDHG